MTVLADTKDYLVEYEQWAGHRLLTITDKFNGKCKALEGPKIAGEFRSCVRSHGAERATRTYLKIARRQQWQQLYKPMVLICRPSEFLPPQ